MIANYDVAIVVIVATLWAQLGLILYIALCVDRYTNLTNRTFDVHIENAPKE